MTKNKENQGSLFRQIIWYSITVTLLLVILGCLYWFFKDTLQFTVLTLPVLLLYLAIAWFLLMWLSPFILQGWHALARAEALKKINRERSTKERVQEKQIHYLAELHKYLRTRYNLFWRRKVRLLLVTGDDEAIEQLVPGLQENQWLEGNRTVLIDQVHCQFLWILQPVLLF